MILFCQREGKTEEFLPVYISNKDDVANLFMKLLLRDITRKFIVDLELYK